MQLTGLNFQMDAWADKLLLYQNSTSFKVRVLTLSFFSWGHHNLDYDFYNITINSHNLWIWIMFFRIFVVVQSLSHVRLFVTPWTAARQAPLSFTISQDLLKLMSIELVMPSNHLALCHPLLLLPSIFPSIRTFSNESVLLISWPKYWSFSFQWIFRTDLLAAQGTLKSLFQHHSLKASILLRSAFFIVQLPHLHMTTRKTIAFIVYRPLSA